jgi:hypothetical protein
MSKDFELANRTHCDVYNVFPSVSSCISIFYPQSTIWRLAIGIDSFPRYLIAMIYFDKYYARMLVHATNPAAFRLLIRVAFFLHIIELTSLLILTYVSSVEIFSIHMLAFVVFLASSSFYMLATIGVYYWPRQQGYSLSKHELKSRLKKQLAFGLYFLSFMLSLYFYIRHNRYCEPYVYSFFSLFEYVTILVNIYYHSLIIHDLSLNKRDKKIALTE